MNGWMDGWMKPLYTTTTLFHLIFNPNLNPMLKKVGISMLISKWDMVLESQNSATILWLMCYKFCLIFM
jgi:hypothetical protein